MGRHTVPGSGRPTPDKGFWVRLAATVVVMGLVGAYVLSRDDDGPTTTTSPGLTTTPSETTSSTAAEPTTSPTPSATSTSATASPTSASAAPTASDGKRPPTLSLRVLRPSYITVRIPGGRTLVSRLFRAGERRSFDQKILQVVNGRPSDVRFRVNGELRKPGPSSQPETFTVRRR